MALCIQDSPGCVCKQEKRAPRAAKQLEHFTVSFSGDIQDPPGQGPEQPALGDPASAGGLD